jgi:hypothetical protein
MVNQTTIDIVKSTAPLLKKHGQQITTRMYEILFQKHPEVKEKFDMSAQADGSQPVKLATAVYLELQPLFFLPGLGVSSNPINPLSSQRCREFLTTNFETIKYWALFSTFQPIAESLIILARFLAF